MEAREEADKINDFGRDPIGEGREEQVCCLWLDNFMDGVQQSNDRHITRS